MKGFLVGALALSLGLALTPLNASGQELADFDYENLAFRGFSLEGGYIWPTRVDPAYSLGMRLDMGYLGPGLRIVPGISYWSSSMKASEVAELENKMDALILGQVAPSPGWMGTNLYTDSKHKEKAEYMKRLGQYRVKAKKFLTYGEFLDMIEPENRVITLTEYWPDHFGVPQNATLPSAMGALWKAEDGTIGIFLVNFLNKENRFEYSLNPAEYGMPDKGNYKLIQLTPEENRQIGAESSGLLRRSESLGPREIKVIEIQAVQ